MNTTAIIGDHWTHQRFARNLLAASHDRELVASAREWRCVFGGVSDDAELHCHLCNMRIRNFLSMENRVNGNALVIGETCYDKLATLPATGTVESPLASRKDLRKYLRAAIRNLPARETVVDWFVNELDGGRLPEHIAVIVRTIRSLGYAPSYTVADAVVAYYTAHRLLPIDVLVRVAPDERTGLPTHITIDEARRMERYRWPVEREDRHDADDRPRVAPTVHLAVLVQDARHDLFEHDNGVWRHVAGRCDPQPDTSGVFVAERVKRLGHAPTYRTLRPSDHAIDLTEVAFFIKRGGGNGFSGSRENGRVVLPLRPVRRRGTYRCLIVETKEFYDHAWVMNPEALGR